MNRANRFSRLTCALVLIVVCGSVGAAPVSIVNASFETPALSDNGFVNGINGWIGGGTGAAGIFNPLAGQVATPSDGVQVAFLNGGNPTSATQMLSTVLVAGEAYVLQADFAYRANNDPASFSLALLAGASEVASFTGTFADGFNSSSFTTATVNFTGPLSGPLIGAVLGVRISVAGQSSSQILVDNVRLDATPNPVPIPASGLLLAPALGSLAHRRRRANRTQR